MVLLSSGSWYLQKISVWKSVQTVLNLEVVAVGCQFVYDMIYIDVRFSMVQKALEA